jgi:hypothetical protein
MDKKELEDRLHKLELLRDSHLQDIEELTMVIDGLKRKMKNAPNISNKG